MTAQPPSYRGYRSPPEIISHAVWVYHRFDLSFRDVEDLLAERGVTVTYESIRLSLPETRYPRCSRCSYTARLIRSAPSMTALLVALLDRLTHHVHILELNGESYRLAHSKKARHPAAAPAS